MPYSSNLFFRIYNGDSKASAYPVLLLHGSGGSHLAWPAEVRRLPHHRVLAVDLPGHGKSNTPVCQSLEALQIAIQSFLLDQQIHKVIMVGHSLGAAAALSFASNYPEQVCGLFLLACGSRFNIPLDWFTSLLNADRKKSLLSKLAKSYLIQVFLKEGGKNYSHHSFFYLPQPSWRIWEFVRILIRITNCQGFIVQSIWLMGKMIQSYHRLHCSNSHSGSLMPVITFCQIAVICCCMKILRLSAKCFGIFSTESAAISFFDH